MAIKKSLDVSVDPLTRMEAMGFRKVADWKLADGKLECRFHDQTIGKNVLYAFVSDRKVLYIGKTVRLLRRRMHGYRRPASTQSTNVKGNSLLVKTLMSRKQVELFALPDLGLLYYGGFHINLAAALEDSLLSVIKPPWNRRGI